MKEIMKKLPAFLLVMLLLCTVSAKAATTYNGDSGIAPYYVALSLVDSTLEINRSGKATCTAIAKVDSMSYSIILTCKLCETDGTIVKSWSTTGKGTVSLNKSWYVTSGSRYQVEATATVYDANGNYVDSGTAYSSVVSY